MERSSSTTSMCAISLDSSFASDRSKIQFQQIALSNARQFHSKFRAAIFFGGDADSSAMRLHNLIDDRETQARAALESRLQRLENFLTRFRVHADACVLKTNAHQKWSRLQPYCKRTSAGHRAES